MKKPTFQGTHHKDGGPRFPAPASRTGGQGGFPGVSPNNGGNRGTPKGAEAGSGHDPKESKRSSHTGYGNVHPSVRKRGSGEC